MDDSRDGVRTRENGGRVAMIDAARLAAAVRETLLALGEDPDRPGLSRTPERIVASWQEFYAGRDASIRASPSESAAPDDLIIVRDVDFISVCEHHLLPFSGVVHVAYRPRLSILGLGEIPKLVRRASSRLGLQEMLTRAIAEDMHRETDAHGVLVVVEARHGCVSDRGARLPRTRVVTVATCGEMESPELREAVVALMGERVQ
jgi:GTP cyclohydrolase IA